MLGTRSIEITRAIRRGIANASEQGRSYLHTLNRSVLSSFFLIQDPHHVRHIREKAMRRTYYLDTNVYLAWMYASQPQHNMVDPLLRTLVAHGANIKILPQTEKEILRIEAQVKRTLLGLVPTDRSQIISCETGRRFLLIIGGQVKTIPISSLVLGNSSIWIQRERCRD